jgi:hypothetical protein
VEKRGLGVGYGSERKEVLTGKGFRASAKKILYKGEFHRDRKEVDTGIDTGAFLPLWKPLLVAQSESSTIGELEGSKSFVFGGESLPQDVPKDG